MGCGAEVKDMCKGRKKKSRKHMSRKQKEVLVFLFRIKEALTPKVQH